MTDEFVHLKDACVEVVSALLEEYRPQLLQAALLGDRREQTNARHADNFLSEFDLALHDHYRSALRDRLPGFFFLSEEGEPEAVGPDPEIAILVDPLDTSELAVRGLNGYTHLLAYSLTEERPLVAVVGDFYHQVDLYVGASNGTHTEAALRTRAGQLQRIQMPDAAPPDRLLVTSYNMRPGERYVPLAKQRGLMSLLTNGPEAARPDAGPTGDYGRIGVDFGSIGFCHVATGATDVFLEFAKGFALWDLLPGQFILECAGGVVCDLEGKPLPWPTSAFVDIGTMQDAMGSRQTFVAARSSAVAEYVAAAIEG